MMVMMMMNDDDNDDGNGKQETKQTKNEKNEKKRKRKSTKQANGSSGLKQKNKKQNPQQQITQVPELHDSKSFADLHGSANTASLCQVVSPTVPAVAIAIAADCSNQIFVPPPVREISYPDHVRVIVPCFLIG